MNSSYVYSHGWTWQNFLQAQSFEGSIKSEISNSTRELIGTVEQMRSEGIMVASAMQAGIEEISWNLSAIQRSVDEVNGTLVWGFTEVLLSLGRMGDSIDELVRLQQNRNRAYAFEFFRNAHLSFERGWHAEALRYVELALNGDGTRPGYDLEFRFHHLLGLIRLGNIRNRELSIVNPAAAESAFIKAVRYSEQDDQSAAALSALKAGDAAYCCGAHKRAIEHYKKSVGLFPKLAEAHYQLSKTLMNLGQFKEAYFPLKTAIEINPTYATRAATDGDFARDRPTLDRFLGEMRNEAKRQADIEIANASRKLRGLLSIAIDGYDVQRFAGAALEQATQFITHSTSEAFSGTYIGFIRAKRHAQGAVLKIVEAFVSFQTEVNRTIAREQAGFSEHYKQLYAGKMEKIGLGLCAGVFVGVGVLILVAWQPQLRGLDDIPFIIFCSLAGAAVAAIAFGFVIAFVAGSIFDVAGGATRSAAKRRDAELHEIARRVVELQLPP